MKIILFGGAFNPVHNEHVAMLRAAQAAIGAEKTIIMPTAVSPHKRGRIAAPPAARLEMCRLAFDGLGEVSDYEIKKGGASYSYITCEHLRRQYPADEIYFLMGADMFACFPQWVYPERILKCVTIAVCARQGGADVEEARLKVKQLFGAEPFVVGYTGAPVSSTRVRVAAAIGADISEYVPQSVAEYISANRFYLNPALKEAQKLLTPSRAAHTLRVAFMAAENCSRAGIDEQTAVTAAALHDCGKYVKLSDGLLKGFTPPAGVPDSVMHQYTGAYIAERRFGVSDGDILNAIRYHTSGRAGMSALEKLIYLSDMLEEGRSFAGVEELRAAFCRDADECMELALKHQLEYLNSNGQEVYPLTAEACKDICARRATADKKITH